MRYVINSERTSVGVDAGAALTYTLEVRNSFARRQKLCVGAEKITTASSAAAAAEHTVHTLTHIMKNPRTLDRDGVPLFLL